MLTRKRAAFVLGLLGSAAASGVAHAGIITYTPFDNDANSGISNANVYTHAIDAGDSTAPTVNGVVFTPYTETNSINNDTVANFRHTGAAGVIPPANGEGGGSPVPIPAGEGTRELMLDFIWGGSATDDSIVSGLTPGVTYDARVYIRSWSSQNREVTITFDEDGFGPLAATTGLFNEDDARTRGFASQFQPYYINYRYTATTEPLRIVVASTQVDQYHFHAFTNQVVPEPASVGLLALGGGAALLARRRRRD